MWPPHVSCNAAVSTLHCVSQPVFSPVFSSCWIKKHLRDSGAKFSLQHLEQLPFNPKLCPFCTFLCGYDLKNVDCWSNQLNIRMEFMPSPCPLPLPLFVSLAEYTVLGYQIESPSTVNTPLLFTESWMLHTEFTRLNTAAEASLSIINRKEHGSAAT